MTGESGPGKGAGGGGGKRGTHHRGTLRCELCAKGGTWETSSGRQTTHSTVRGGHFGKTPRKSSKSPRN